MRMSLQAQYAICGMFDLAYNGATGAPVQVRVIGERQGIPPRYLEQIFQRLRKADLVVGKRGPGGGYVLAREPKNVTLRAVIEAVEGPLEAELGEGPPPRDGADSHRPTFLWPDLAARLGAALDQVDLEDLCRRAAAGAIPRAGEDGPMWHI